MSLTIEKIFKNKTIRDKIETIENIKSCVFNDKVYFFGGSSYNNISKMIFYYDIKLKDVVKLPESISQYSTEFVLMDEGTLVLVDEKGNQYHLKDDGWNYHTTSDEDFKNSTLIVVNGVNYVISQGVLFKYTQSTFTIVHKSPFINSNDYITSPDKNIIYFINGTYNVETDEFVDTNNTGEYILYGIDHSTIDNFVIDKERSLIIYYDNPITTLKIKTFSGGEIYTDVINNDIPTYSDVSDMIIDGNQLYIITKQGSIHQFYKFDNGSNTLEKEFFITRQNNSYSKNIKYNHSEPKGIAYENNLFLVGNGAFYTDNSVYDNSLYNDKVTIPLSLNIERPLYSINSGIVTIGDKENNILYRYSIDGSFINSEYCSISKNAIYMNEYKNSIVIDCLDFSYRFDKKTHLITNTVVQECISSYSDQYFKYSIIDDDGINLIRTSIDLRSKDSYRLDIKKDEYNQIIIRGLNNRIYICIINGSEWELYRVNINE